MNYSKRDVVIGFVIIILIVAGAFYYKKVRTPKPVTTPTPVSIEFKKDFADSFKIDIPSDVNTIELKDVSGGDSRGIATNREILIDANDPEKGFYYEAWLESSDKLVSLGKLQIAKGGWMLSYDNSKNLDSTKVVISLEKINDNKIEKRILEGSFN